MNIFLWFFLLIIQNAAFTWVSRARNSGSLIYHAQAAVCSNGVWFVSQLFMIAQVTKPGMDWVELTCLGLVYVVGTTIGSVLMHYVSMRWLEKGKRKVGS